MPDEDQTGPRGEGPLTGRGLGRADAEEADLEERTRIEAERQAEREEELRRRAATETQPAAQTSIDNYISRLGHQMKITKDVSKTALKVAGTAAVVGTAASLGFLAFGMDALTVSGGLIGGDWLAKWKNKEKITAKDTMVKGIAGAVLGGFLHYAFPAVHYIGDSAANLVSGAGASSFATTATSVATKTGAFIGAGFPSFIYLENNILYNMLDPKFKPFNKKEFMDAWKRATKYIGLPAALNINFMPEKLQIPGAAAITLLYGFVSSKPKEKPNEIEQKSPATAKTYDFPQQGQYANKRSA